MASLSAAVITVSDTRTVGNDASGEVAASALQGAGHVVCHRAIVPDEAERIASEVVSQRRRGDVAVVILTGGTGVSPRDVTPEAVGPLLTLTLPGFGEIFRARSYATIGSAALLSRALAGFIGPMLVVCLPGSPSAVAQAMEELVLPQLLALHQLRTGAALTDHPEHGGAAAGRGGSGHGHHG